MTTQEILEKSKISFSIDKTFYKLLLSITFAFNFKRHSIFILGEEKEDIGAKGSCMTIEKKKNVHGSFTVFLEVTFMP